MLTNSRQQNWGKKIPLTYLRKGLSHICRDFLTIWLFGYCKIRILLNVTICNSLKHSKKKKKKMPNHVVKCTCESLQSYHFKTCCTGMLSLLLLVGPVLEKMLICLWRIKYVSNVYLPVRCQILNLCLKL